MFDYDSMRPLDVRAESRSMTDGVSVTDVSYDHAGGGRAAAFVVRGDRMAGGVIIAHGGSADGRRFFLGEAAELARLGFFVLLPATSFPAHGDIGVTASAVRTAVLTQRRGVDVLTSWAGVEPHHLGFFGHSAGAFQGAILSAVEPRFSGIVVASFGGGTLARLAAEELRQADPQRASTGTEPYLTALHRFDPVHYVAMGGRRRLFFQHGRADTVVSRTEAVGLLGAAVPPRQWSEYACGHGTDADPDARRDRAEFFASFCGHQKENRSTP